MKKIFNTFIYCKKIGREDYSVLTLKNTLYNPSGRICVFGMDFTKWDSYDEILSDRIIHRHIWLRK